MRSESHKTMNGYQNMEFSSALSSPDDLQPLMERIGDAHFVLLGEASHGTHQYYTWRAQLSKRLIEEKGFSFIAVEGDWPDCYKINRFVKGYADIETEAVNVLKNFKRWPTWMWANWEVLALMDWLKTYNKNLPSNKRVGFYGLDVYSLWESIDNMVEYLKKEDPEAAKAALRVAQCFEPYHQEEQLYAQMTSVLPNSCKEEVVNLLREIRLRSPFYNGDPEAALNTAQNAYIAVNAEKYYRSMISSDTRSWNIRDIHMADTIDRLMNFHGSNAKAIIWEHNTHIGDARATDMAAAGMVNIGQLLREKYGDLDTVLVGFASFSGTVIAGKSWGAPMEKMVVPPAREGSIEHMLHTEGAEDRLLIFDKKNRNERFNKELLHRAIGVVYDPEKEKYGNYVPSVIASRYDALIYLDETAALNPLHIEPSGGQIPETYPFGV